MTLLALLVPGALLMLEHAGAYVARFAAPHHAPKFAASFAELVYYVFSVAWLWRALGGAPWLWPPHAGVGVVAWPPDLCVAYAVEASFYATGLVLLTTRPRRRDFAVMACHHGVTLALLALSYAYGYLRAGALVLLLHNVFDPLLQAAKCAHYARVPLAANVFFGASIGAFAAPRLVLFPLVMRALWQQGAALALLGLLGTLLPLHLYWLRLLLRVLVRALRHAGVDGDARSDSDRED